MIKAKVKNLVKLVGLNYVILVVLLVSLELFGQLFFRLAKGTFIFRGIPIESVFIEHPYLVGVPKKNSSTKSPDGKITITTNEFGYRVTSLTPQTKDSTRTTVVCLGGSTTFGTGATDKHTWPFMLQTKLGNDYQVYNLGVPGFTTMEAIIQMTTIVNELKPDIIIFYQGWNDMRNYHTDPSPDYYWHGLSQESSLQLKKDFKTDLTDRLAISYFAKWLNQRLLGGVLSKMPPPEFTTYDYPDPRIDSLYKRNLRTLNVLGQQLTAKRIFVPQVLNTQNFLESKNKSRWWTPHIPDQKVPEFMERFNKLMETSIPEDMNAQVVKGLYPNPNWQPEHFIDDGHFSEQGADYFTGVLMGLVEPEQHY